MWSELRSHDFGAYALYIKSDVGNNLPVIVSWAMPQAPDRLRRFVITLPYGSLKSHDHKTISDSADLETMSLELRWILLFTFFPLWAECGWAEFSEMAFLRYPFSSIFCIPSVARNTQQLLNFNCVILSACPNGNQLLQNLWHRRSLSRSQKQKPGFWGDRGHFKPLAVYKMAVLGNVEVMAKKQFFLIMSVQVIFTQQPQRK